MNLHFLSPAYLAGLLGVALPILVHLLTRRQETRIRFSAVYLLLQSKKKSVRRARPNRLLLLAIRCLAIAFLSLALANPIFSSGADDILGLTPSANVLVLDDSYSMGARAGDADLFALAAKTASDLLERLQEKSPVSWVWASAPAKLEQSWTLDRRSLIKRLEVAQPSKQTTDIGGALQEALRLLESTDQKIRRVHLLTDLDHNGWIPESFEGLKGAKHPPEIFIHDVSRAQTAANRAAVESVAVRQEFLQNSRMARISARIKNLLEGKPIQGLRISLWINGKKRDEAVIDVPRLGTAEKEFSFPLEGSDTLSGYVEIDPDALEADDRRYFTYQPDRKLKALVVDGDPKTVAHQSETFYLERALNPFYSPVSDIEPSVATLAELSSRRLEDYAVVILCNARELPPEFEMALEKFVVRGGALMIALGDQIDPKFYNEKMGNLIPVRLETLQQAAGDQPFHLALENAEHPVMEAFKGKTLKEMEEIRFRSLYRLAERSETPAKIPLRFQNGMPAVAEYDFGMGKTMVFASTLDRDWNDFPIQPTFLPWVQRWTKYLAKGLQGIDARDLLVGQAFRLDPEREGRLWAQTPEGAAYSMQAESGGRQMKFDRTLTTGVYALYFAPEPEASPEAAAEIKSAPLPPGAERIGGFAVNVDTGESLPEKISQAEIRRLLEGFNVTFSADEAGGKNGSSRPGVPLSTPLLLLVALALFHEGWLVRKD